MNQIEFIKKWAKHGDRIEDGERKFFFCLQEGKPCHALELNHEALYGFDAYTMRILKWQSPKIYRSLDPIEWESKKGYTEGWELIADYADEKKDEEDIVKVCHSKQLPTESKLEILTHHFESRLKSLEDKIK